jgi:hypothetical protein
VVAGFTLFGKTLGGRMRVLVQPLGHVVAKE